jgi:hypothetical protein
VFILTVILVGLYINQIVTVAGLVSINREDFQIVQFNVTQATNKFNLVAKIVYAVKNDSPKPIKLTHAEISVFYQHLKIASSFPRSDREVAAYSQLKPDLELDIEIETTKIPSEIISEMRNEISKNGNLKLSFGGQLGIVYHYVGYKPIITFEQNVAEK